MALAAPTPLGRRQRRNLLRALLAVQERAHNQNWDPERAKHAAFMVVECVLTESNLHNYGNPVSSESYRLADKTSWGTRYIGSDHDSVGLFQQRESWGTTHDRMEPKLAAHKFLRRASEVGVDNRNGLPTREDIQKVQVSFDPSGWNYGYNQLRARALVRRYWSHEHRGLKTRKQLKLAKTWSFPK